MKKYVIIFAYDGDDGNEESEEEREVSFRGSLRETLRHVVTLGEVPEVPPIFSSRVTFTTAVLTTDGVDHQNHQERLRSSNCWQEWNGLESTESLVRRVRAESLADIRGRKMCQVVAEKLHRVADFLPSPGSCLVEVLWLVRCVPDPMEAVELLGVLKRLTTWNQANLKLVGALPSNCISTWKQLVGLSNCEEHEEEECWRGWLGLQDSPRSEKVALSTVQLCFQGSRGEVTNRRSPRSCRKKNSVHPLGVLEVLEECDAATVPSFYFTGHRLTLQISSQGSGKEALIWLFKKWAKDPRMAVLLRLRCVGLALPKSARLDSSLWKRRLSEGKLEPPLDLIGWSSERRGRVENLLFLLTFEDADESPSKGTVHLLHTVTETACVIPSEVLTKHFLPSEESREDIKVQVEGLLQALPQIDGNKLVWLSRLIEQIQTRIMSEYHNEYGMISQENVYWIKQEVTSILLEKYNIDWLTQSHHTQTTLMLEADHPEIRALRCQEGFVIVETPVTLANSLQLGAKDILSKMRKSQMQMMDLNSVSKRNSDINCGLDFVLGSKWPQVKTCRFHDIYYCRDVSCEESARQCNEITERLIPTETVSTCNAFFSKSTVVVPLIKSDDEVVQSTLSVATRQRRQTFGGMGGEGTPKKTPAQRRVSDAAILRSLRRSPRLQSRQQCNPETSSVVSSSSARSVQKPAGGLSEVHRKKLRYAVTKALEEEGVVGSSHPLFAPSAKKLFAICKTMVSDLVMTPPLLSGDSAGYGNCSRRRSTTQVMLEVARSHVKQVVQMQAQWAPK